MFVEQAAAHGLPIVATKNGGPVDIHRVCLLIDRWLCIDLKRFPWKFLCLIGY